MSCMVVVVVITWDTLVWNHRAAHCWFLLVPWIFSVILVYKKNGKLIKQWHWWILRLNFRLPAVLKVPAACLPSSPRMTPSRMTLVTRTAAAVRVMTQIRRRTCWMNRSRGPLALPMPTVPLRPHAPCNGQCGPLPASAQPGAPPPAPPLPQVGRVNTHSAINTHIMKLWSPQCVQSGGCRFQRRLAGGLDWTASSVLPFGG